MFLFFVFFASSLFYPSGVRFLTSSQTRSPHPLLPPAVRVGAVARRVMQPCSHLPWRNQVVGGREGAPMPFLGGSDDELGRLGI